MLKKGIEQADKIIEDVTNTADLSLKISEEK